jgi:5-methylcytosine-specific restriction endonuclease McrA
MEQNYYTWRVTQQSRPTKIYHNGQRQWWWFEDKIYWENERLDEADVVALVREQERRQADLERRQARRLQRAHENLQQDTDDRPRRASTPREMRRTVFDRDGGRCVECGSSFDLQYDHIIPVVLGGATSVENLQLLCADCNREKSGSL